MQRLTDFGVLLSCQDSQTVEFIKAVDFGLKIEAGGGFFVVVGDFDCPELEGQPVDMFARKLSAREIGAIAVREADRVLVSGGTLKDGFVVGKQIKAVRLDFLRAGEPGDLCRASVQLGLPDLPPGS